MKKVLIILIITIFQSLQLGAQNTLNNAADNIVGTYLGTQNGDNFNVKIVKYLCKPLMDCGRVGSLCFKLF